MDKKILGERIRLARDRKGFSQEHLANLVEKDQRGISEIEAGSRKLSVTELPNFAKALDVAILYFLKESFQKMILILQCSRFLLKLSMRS